MIFTSKQLKKYCKDNFEEKPRDLIERAHFLIQKRNQWCIGLRKSDMFRLDYSHQNYRGRPRNVLTYFHENLYFKSSFFDKSKKPSKTLYQATFQLSKIFHKSDKSLPPIVEKKKKENKENINQIQLSMKSQSTQTPYLSRSTTIKCKNMI